MSAVKRLATRKMAMDAAPKGSGLSDVLAFLSDHERVRESGRAAQEWALAAIQAVREGAEPNPWRHSTDEEIAEEIMRRVDEKEGKVLG